MKANLSWCLSFFYPLLHIYCEDQHNQNNNKNAPSVVSCQFSFVTDLTRDTYSCLGTSICCVCGLNKMYSVFICQFTSICEHPKAHGRAAPRLIQNVWPGFLWISQRSIMQRKSQFLDRIHHVVCCPGSGFSLGPLSILIFQASGVPAVVEGQSMISHPTALFCGCEASCLPPSCWLRLGIVHNRSHLCVHRWLCTWICFLHFYL